MRKYITTEKSGEHTGVEFGREFGSVDIARILEEIVESDTVQYFGAKRGGSIMSNLEMREGVLYFGCCDGNFYAVDAKTGKELWRFPAGDVFLSFDMCKETIYASCYDRNLYAIGLDGREKWRFRTEGKLGNVLCNNGRVYFGSEGGNFYCVDESGRLLWKFPTDSLIGAKPLAVGGMVIFGDFHGTFYSLDAENGSLKWKLKTNGGLGGGIFYDGLVYLPCMSNVLYALYTDSRVAWKRNFGNKLLVDTQFKPYKGMVFAGGRSGGFYALSAKTGEVIWKLNTDAMPNVFSAEYNGTIYVGDLDNKFYAIDAMTGKVLWSLSTSGPNTGGVAIDGGLVYFGSWDCNAYCLDAKTGRLVWKFHTSMGSMSDYETDRRADKPELSITIQLPEEESKGAVKEEPELADYGEFSGAYIDKEKTDYVKAGKKGYVRKKDF